MTNFQTNGIKIHIKTEPAVKVSWKVVEGDDVGVGGPEIKSVLPKLLPAWSTDILDAGFTQLDYSCELEQKEVDLGKSSHFSMSFLVNQHFLLDDETEEMLLLVVEDEEGKILSIQTAGRDGLQQNFLVTGQVEFKAVLSLPAISRSILKIYKKTIKTIKKAWEKISQWDDVLKKSFYKATDLAFFEPKNGFGLKYLQNNGQTGKIDGEQRDQMVNRRSLLLIHGIFSDVESAFTYLAQPEESGSESVLQHLLNDYQSRVYGFDHATFSKNSLENALELMESLPADVELDLICHSRGGQVTRCLLEHPLVGKIALDKNIKFKKVLFVAGACQGSQLASDAFLNDFLLLVTGLKIISGIGVLVQLLEVIAKFAHNAPGVTCLDPASKLIQVLDKHTGHNLAQTLSFCRANYDPHALPKDIMDEIVFDQTVFSGEANDLIVPYATANIAESYETFQKPEIIAGVDFGSADTVQSVVFHLNYFKQQEIKDKILEVFGGV